jgi:hypothetical protein
MLRLSQMQQHPVARSRHSLLRVQHVVTERPEGSDHEFRYVLVRQKAHETSVLDGEHPLGVNHFACIRETRLNVFECDMAVLLPDVLRRIAAGEQIKDEFNADPRALDHRLPDQHVRVGDDARSPVQSRAPLR